MQLALPAPADLERLTRALATLDAILSEDWESRCYSFNAKWSATERMASYRDGSGDEWFLVFSAAGVFLKGFAHEYAAGDVSTIYAGLPEALRGFLDEPAFSIEDTTYGGWCADRWELRAAPDAEGIVAEHLALLDGKPASYRAYARDYFEASVPLAAIAHVYEGRPLDQALVSRICKGRKLRGLKEDLEEIGYGG